MTATTIESTPSDLLGSSGMPLTTTLLDRALPTWDAARVEHRVIMASIDRVYDAALNADMLDAVRQHRIVRALFAIRRAFERVVTGARGRPWVEPPPPASLRLRDIPERGEWVLLGADRPREIAFGVIGRFWAGATKWETIDRREFVPFEQPGFAKIACHLLLRDLGDGGVLLSYEARTRATDAASRRAFRRYWRLTSPFIGIVMRALLAVIERGATARRG